MKKFIFGLISVMFVSVMAFSLSSCSKEEVEPEVTIIGTWRHYTDKANGYYYQITLEEDGTLIWREYNSRGNHTSYDTYTYEDGYITWYEKANDIEAIWYVYKLYESTMVTYKVSTYDETQSSHQIIWTRVE